MLEYDFEQSVGFWIITAANAFQRALNDEVAPHGITYRQCQALGYLALDGPLSQTELAERMRVEPPTLVGILDRMERDGWIVRKNCPHDRRKKLIHPTPAAEPVWSKMVTCAKRVRARAVAGLSPEEIEVLKQLLDAIQQNLTAPIHAEEVA